MKKIKATYKELEKEKSLTISMSGMGKTQMHLYSCIMIKKKQH